MPVDLPVSVTLHSYLEEPGKKEELNKLVNDICKWCHPPKPECKHIIVTDELITDDTYNRNGITYPYCPKCGDKL
jgi:hypothetical protein